MKKPHRLPLYAPASRAAFECSACGACCTGWAITVDRASFHALEEKLPAHGRSASSTMRVLDRPTDLEHAVLRHTDGHCVFLDDDRLCWIHKTLGPEAKPIACRSFPSKSAAAMPSSRNLAPSFGCPGMLEALERTAGDLELRRDPFEWVAGQATVRLRPADRVPFDGRRSGGLHADGFEAAMLGIRRILQRTAGSVESRVLAARLWLDDLARLPRWLDGAAVRASLEGVLADGGTTLTACAEAMHRRQGVVQLRILRTIMDRRIAHAPLPPSALERFRAVVQRYDLAEPGLGCGTLAHAADLAERYRPGNPELDPIARSYAADKLFYNSEFLRVGLFPGFHSALCLLALVRLFAVTDAATRSTIVDKPTLLRSIHFVELQFAHATQLFDFWSDGDHTETIKLPFAADMLAA